MELFLYVIVALTLLAIAIGLWRLAARRATLGVICALIVAAGLVYDNSVISVGVLIGPGPLLEALNWPRFIIHALATPLLILFALDAARRAGLKWSHTRGWQVTFWLLTAAMIGYGVVVDLVGLQLEPQVEGTVVSYSAAGGPAAPVPAMVTLVAVLTVGIALWAAVGWWGLAVGSILAGIGFGLGPALELSVVGQMAEVALMAGILATERWLHERPERTRVAGEAAVTEAG